MASDFYRNRGKRLREESSVLDCIHRDLVSQKEGFSPASLLYLLDTCRDDLSKIYSFSFFFVPEEQKLEYDEGNIMHLAVLKNVPELVSALIERCMDMTARTKKGRSLMDLAMYGNSRFFPEKNNSVRVSMVHLLLDHQCNVKAHHIAEILINRSPNMWEPDIMVRMVSVLPNILEINCPHYIDLENLGSNIPWVSARNDMLPLIHIAAYRKNRTVIMALLKKDAHFRHVSKFLNLNIIDCLFLNFSPQNLIQIHDILQIVLPMGIKIDVGLSRDRSPPLHIAVMYSFTLDIIELLLRYGADPNGCFKGRCLLQLARSNAVRRLLLEHGADPNIETSDFYCPLFNAISREEDLMYLEFGADVSTWDRRGTSFFHHHFVRGNTEVIFKALQHLIQK